MRIDITRRAAYLATLSLLLTLFFTACARFTAAPPTATPTATAPGPPPVALRELNLSEPPFSTDLIRRAGGGDVPRERISYLDLTGDGVDEAVAVVESGGTLGDIGVGVFRAGGPSVALVYFRKLGGRVEVRNRSIVVIEGAPAPNDPACCPSQLRESVIEWRNGNFEVTAERLVTNPTGPPPGGR